MAKHTQTIRRQQQHISQGSQTILRRCYVKKVFLKFLQNSLENTCTGVSF